MVDEDETSATVSGGAEFSATENSDVGEVGSIRSIGTRNGEGLTLPDQPRTKTLETRAANGEVSGSQVCRIRLPIQSRAAGGPLRERVRLEDRRVIGVSPSTNDEDNNTIPFGTIVSESKRHTQIQQVSYDRCKSFESSVKPITTPFREANIAKSEKIVVNEKPTCVARYGLQNKCPVEFFGMGGRVLVQLDPYSLSGIALS